MQIRAYDAQMFGIGSQITVPNDGQLYELPGGGKIRLGFPRPARIFDANSPRYGREFSADDAMRQTALS